MSIFDSEVKPTSWTGVPGWELPGHQNELKRQLERHAVAEVQQQEHEKQAVNVHVAINEQIHGGTSRDPIEIDSRKA